MSDDENETNGTELPPEMIDASAPEDGSPEHVLGIIASRLDHLDAMTARALDNDAIIAQALAMILSGAAQKVLMKEEVEAMIRRLDPDAKFTEVSPLLRGIPGRH